MIRKACVTDCFRGRDGDLIVAASNYGQDHHPA